MKTKKFDKKLSLNKNTVADLDIGEMNEVVGGLSGPICSIRPCTIYDCTNEYQCPSAPWTNCTEC